mmetsp:Transcript_65157/g.102641  ORF Transcript_65157/g.102641 Transcript_65157/m.102641 type:complete len:288 (+) Transcript_65157:340-1203(+)
MSSVLLATIASFTAFSFSANFFSFVKPNLSVSKAELISNSSTSNSFFISLNFARRYSRVAMISLDWYSNFGASPGLFSLESNATALGSFASEGCFATALTRPPVACKRSNFAPFILFFESLSAAMAASQAAMASSMSFAFTRYASCSFSRFSVFFLISSSKPDIFLLRSAISTLSLAIAVSRNSIWAFKSAIFFSDFSIAYNLSLACSLQKHAYLSYCAASSLPSATTFVDKSFKSSMTFSIGVTCEPCAAAATRHIAHKNLGAQITMAQSAHSFNWRGSKQETKLT